MAKATTSSGTKDEGPAMTAQELADKKAELDAEIDAEYGKDPSDEGKEEPAEKPDSQKEPEQEQEKDEPEESEDVQTPEEASKAEPESDPEEKLTPKEQRYKEQLAGERKASQELQAKLQAVEAKLNQLATPPQQQREFTEEEKQFLEEKKMLKEKYGLVEKQEVLELLDARLKPVQKKREQTILQNLYNKFPDVSPDKDTSNEKWAKVTALVNRFAPSNPADPLDDYEERFEWAHEKVFGKKTSSAAQERQTSYTSVGGGASAAKSRTTVGNDKYAHLSPVARARKEAFDRTLEEEWAREDAKK